MVIRTRDGRLELVEFRPAVAYPGDGVPLTFVLVAAQCQGRTLLIHHAERRQWELPGGGIEPGETPDDCATRELWEETGQTAAAFDYKGLFKIRFPRNQRYVYGILFGAQVDSLTPFAPNNEVDRILLWDRSSRLDDHMSEINRGLLRYC